jgi:hypothetical protein
MKLKRSIAIWLMFSIIYSSQVSACEVTGPNQLEIVLRPDSGVNMTLLNKYCEPNSCISSDSKIIYQSHYDPRVGVIISKREIRNPERSNIQILRVGSTLDTNVTGEGKRIFESRVDVTDLSNQEIIELSSRELHHLKINGYISEEKINDLRFNSHQIIIDFTGYYEYDDYRMIREELDDALSKYKKVIRPASVTEVYQIGLIVPENDTKFSSLSFRINLKDLSNSHILDLIQNAPENWDIRDDWGFACAIGMNCLKYEHCKISTECLLSSDEKITEAKSKDHTEVSFVTEAPLYATEDEAINEIKEFLENYDLELPPYIYVESAPTYAVSLDAFNWSVALSLELKTLLSSGVLYGIQDEEIDAIGEVARPRTFIYFKPSGCGTSYLCDHNNSDESGWLVGLGNCVIDEYESNCPKIQCYECGSVSSSLDLPTLPLNLQVPDSGVVEVSEKNEGGAGVVEETAEGENEESAASEEETKTIIFKYIFIGIVIVILILYFIYEKIKK